MITKDEPKIIAEQLDLFGTSTPILEEAFEDKYRKVLSSSRWKKLKEEMRAKRSNLCSRCGISGYTKRLELHHLNYENLGKETLDDVELLCLDCHPSEDAIRETRTYFGNAAQRFERTFRTAWTTKKSNWEEQHNTELTGNLFYIEREKFRRWLFIKYFKIQNFWGNVPSRVTPEWLEDLFSGITYSDESYFVG